MNLMQQRTRQRKQEKHRRKRKAEAVRERYDPNDVRWIAIHEAGHAVAALAYGIPLEYVDIRRRREPDGQVSVGFTRTPPLRPIDIATLGEEEVLSLMAQGMAGPAAEAQADPRCSLKMGHDAHDRQETYRTAAVALCGLVETPDGYEVPREALKIRQGEIVALCCQAESVAEQFAAENRAAIEAVAAALIRKTSLTGDEVAAQVAAATTT